MADAVSRIRAMLSDTRADRRYAAAIVLAELKVKDPATVKALTEAVEGDDRRLGRYALEALAEARSQRSIPLAVRRLVDGDAEMRQAAEMFLLAMGDGATDELQKQLKDGPPELRRAAASVLSKLGGKSGLDALVESIDGTDATQLDQTRAALARAVATLDGKTASRFAEQLEARCGKLIGRGDLEGAGTILRVLGELKDVDAFPFLKRFAAKGQPAPIRRGALGGLARSLAEGRSGKSRDALVGDLLATLFEQDYEDVVRPAVGALHGCPIPAAHEKTLVKLLEAPHPAARQLAVKKLGELGTPAAARALVRVLSTGDNVSRSAARDAVGKLGKVAPLLVDALLEATSSDGARTLASALRPRASELSPADRSRLAEGSLEALLSGLPRAEALAELARHASGNVLCETATERARKLKKKGDTKGAIALLRMVAELPGFDDAARYELALMGLTGASGPMVRVARSTDPVLSPFQALLRSGFPVTTKLAKEKGLGDEELFFLGFAFADSKDDTEKELGCDVLRIVADRSPRSKLGKSAKNKIRLVEES